MPIYQQRFHPWSHSCCTLLELVLFQKLPLSTVRFNVLKVIPAGSSGGAKKAFTGM
ncbi:hypothetical protein TanjilG_30708 [Lupinus angustifolius]|uniref:Uncharacterized protein n=1 Tax=Lupinus angustifolius TaxID=3871 RepID=A0A4P1RPF7_LUPAN|nr:hypothetical protein TanjilG_30708 [Lupinus angustifolius]